MWYTAEDVMILLGVAQTKAYEVIRELAAELVAENYLKPPAGKIQKKLFCEKFLLDREECDALLSERKGKNAQLTQVLC